MIKSINICLGLMCVLVNTLFSQELNGFVKDKNQKGIPYVNIGIPAKAFGIITDEIAEQIDIVVSATYKK